MLSARHRAAAFLGLAGFAAAAWYGCSIYDSSLLLPGADDGGADAADGGPAQDGSDSGDPCAHVSPPGRPATDDGSGDLEVVLAVRMLDIGIREDGGTPPSLGFDLDHTCTCPAPESCVARVQGAQHCDDDAGRDNSGGQLLQNFALVSGGIFSQQSINDRISTGELGLIVRVRHYNGKANDTKVEVAVFVSNGTAGGDGGAPPAPKWDGNDSWTLDSDSVFGGGSDAGLVIPNYVDTNAYVTNGVLVARVDFPLSLGGGATTGIVTLELTGSSISAKLVPEGSSFRIDEGTLSGRWSTKKLLAALAAIHDPTDPSGNGYICPGKKVYDDVKALICKAADIFADPKITDPKLSCDALSIGIGFTMYPAKIGPVDRPRPKTITCPDASADDCQ